MKRYTLSVYEKAMPDTIGWKEKLYTAGEMGFDAVELSIDESENRLLRLDWSTQERLKLLCASRETGINIQSICLSGHRRFPLGSRDPDTVRMGLEIMEKAVALAYDLGARIIQLAGYDVYYERSGQDTASRFEENLIKSVEKASAYGVLLGFETMETAFMNTTARAMRHVRRVNSPYLQVYPDVGNITNAVTNAIRDLQSGSGHIAAAHLKETRPGVFRDLHFGEGHVDFTAVIGELKKQGVRMYTAEFWHHPQDDWKAELKRAHDFLRPYFREADA